MISRLALLAPVVALTIAGCSAQEASAPVSLAPAADGTSSSIAPSVPSSSVPATTGTAPATTEVPATSGSTTPGTTSETTPPASTAPPTTAAPVASGEPTDLAVPVFAGGGGDAWLYVGRWNGTTWQDAFDDGAPATPDVDDGATISIIELGTAAREGSVGAAVEACSGGRTGAVITPVVGTPDVPGFGYRAIAFDPDWPGQPRRVAVVDAAVQAYLDAGRAAFDDDDVDQAAGELDQVVVADLDGDGDTEAVVAFGDDTETDTSLGYSGLLLIDADSGDAATIVKSVSFVPDPPPPATATTETTETAAATTAPAAPTPFTTYRVLAVNDINGDGLMEVVAHAWRGDSAGVIVYTYDGTTVEEALATGCNS